MAASVSSLPVIGYPQDVDVIDKVTSSASEVTAGVADPVDLNDYVGKPEQGLLQYQAV